MSHQTLGNTGGFGTRIEPLIFVVVIGLVAAFAIPFLTDSQIPGELRSGDPEAVLVPTCEVGATVAPGTYREGFGLLSREVRSSEDALVLERHVNTGVILWVAGAALGGFILLFALFYEVPARTEGGEERVRKLADYIPDAVGAGIAFAAWATMLVGILYLLPTLIIPWRVPNEVTATDQGVTWRHRGISLSQRTEQIGPEAFRGVDAERGLRIFFTRETGDLGVLVVPIADDEVARAAACSVAGRVGLEG